MRKPEDINYDIPIEVLRIGFNKDDKKAVTTRIAINWIDIQNIEDYSEAFEEEEVDWGSLGDSDRIYVDFGSEKGGIRVLANYDEFVTLWKYYCKKVKVVDSYQIPDYKRNRIR